MENNKQGVLGFLFIVILVVVGLSIWVIQSSMQAEVYRRQGVNMTTFEIMMGVKPIERVIQIKEN